MVISVTMAQAGSETQGFDQHDGKIIKRVEQHSKEDGECSVFRFYAF